jgi:metallo-beta-lactamase class B
MAGHYPRQYEFSKERASARSGIAWMALLGACALLGPTPYAAQPATPPCTACAEWNVSQKPFKIYGNTWYVGTHGLSSILITSPAGHILIDGGLPESAPKIAGNIRELGFRVEDIKLILNSHVHFDHAGGIAELQRLSGAQVAASERSAPVLKTGQTAKDDPQYGILPEYAPVHDVHVFKDGETLHVGSIAVTAHLTPGHTTGGTSWSWQSCEQSKCLNVVYADSLTAVSAKDFRFSHNTAYPNVVTDFQKTFASLSALPCDILLTPHPDVSGVWERLAKRDQTGDSNAFVDATACRRYADRARENLQKRLAQEQSQP